jgi:hypothetical protein
MKRTLYHLPQGPQGDENSQDRDEKCAAYGQETHNRRVDDESIQHLSSRDEEKADSGQHGGQTDAKGKNQDESEADPMDGYGTQQNHKGRGAGKDPAGYAKGQKTSPGHRGAIDTGRQMRVPMLIMIVVLMVPGIVRMQIMVMMMGVMIESEAMRMRMMIVIMDTVMIGTPGST